MSDHDVKGSCTSCGGTEFNIYYDPAAQGYYVQCRCGSVLGGIDLPSVNAPACDRCGQPAKFRDGKWHHAEIVAGAFCSLVMRGNG